MKAISKRDRERQARREALQAELATSAATSEGAVAPAAPLSPSPAVAVPDSAPAPASHEDTAAAQRAQGAGLTKILGGLKGGMSEQLSETRAELDAAKSELESLRPLKEMADGKAIPVREIDPAEVLPTTFANRDAKSFDPEADRDFKLLLADIHAKGGNTVPGFVRPLKEPHGSYRFEAIYGHRRLRACLALKLPFKALVAPVDDDQAVLLQQTENSHRKKLSAIENGQQVASYLERFRDRETGRAADGALQMLAGAMKSDPKSVGKYALIGSIPEDILDVIPDVREVPYRPALLLARACRDNLKSVLGRASSLPKGAGSRAVVQHLLGNAQAASKPPGRYELQLPTDADDREAIIRDIRALEEKYGVKLGLRSLETT